MSMRECAEIMAKDTALKAQHGEAASRPLFSQYLAQRGVDQNTWAHAWNGWWTRMQSDPSGQLHAKFSTIQQELMLANHFADVPDASQDAKEGVTLDAYARVMAGAAGGGDIQQLVAAEGFDWGQWQRAQAAWNAAMAADVNHHLTTQYGQLYAKYTPGFQQQMQGQVAGIMAADYAARAAGQDDEPDPEYTFEDMVRELEDPKPATRWTAAHHVANQWDIGDKSDPALSRAAQRAYERMIECLEQHDAFTVSDAEAAAGDLKMFASEGLLTAAQAGEAKGCIERCLNRGREHLATLEAAFAPIRDKAVPERVRMQSQLQDYGSLVSELSEIAGEWDDNYQPPEAAPSQGYGGSAGPSQAMQPRREPEEEGFLALLKRLPVIGPLLRMLGL
ncbi:MAG: hypothetical protein R3A79_04390 [Nannocystaceae bacterium]